MRGPRRRRTCCPTIGSKELIASLPTHLGLGPGDVVVDPELAYPTYEVGAALAGATRGRDRRADRARPAAGRRWSGVNSPSNPTGRVLPVDHLRKVVAWCRERGALLVSDECYLECGWDARSRSRCCTRTSATATTTGILTVHSLSKRSNLAGYRCAFVAGDPAVVAELLAVRKNLGLMMPGPQQVAMRAALDDDAHVGEQHERYAARRATLRDGARGGRLPHRPLRGRRSTCGRPATSPAGTPSPGSPTAASWWRRATSTAGRRRHVRVAFTATDERVAAARRAAG